MVAIWAIQVDAQGTYYDGLSDSLRCQQLKAALKKRISTGYTSRNYDEVPGFMQTNDRRQNDAGTTQIIWDMYSDNPSGSEPYEYRNGDLCTNQSVDSESDCWNREHAMPSSWFNASTPLFSDVINLVPTDAFVNNRRSNNPYGKVNSATFTSLNGSKLGSSATTGVSGIVFEPIDAYKGDFARIMLYMITRYEDSIPKWGGADADRVLSNDVFLGFKREYLDLLLQWHEQDPPSQKELNRNNAAQTFQGNRNPFVDRPEYAARIWKTAPDECARFIVSTREQTFSALSLYPNPANGGLIYIGDASKAVGATYYISDITGKQVLGGLLNSNSVDISSLNSGMYILTTISGNKVYTGKFLVQ